MPCSRSWGGVSRPTPKGKVEGDLVQAHSQGEVEGGLPGGGCLVPGGAWWRPPQTATAAGGTHPTGMHSCLYLIYFSLRLSFLVELELQNTVDM